MEKLNEAGQLRSMIRTAGGSTGKATPTINLPIMTGGGAKTVASAAKTKAAVLGNLDKIGQQVAAATPAKSGGVAATKAGMGAKLAALKAKAGALAAAHPLALAGGAHALTAGLIAKKALEKPETKIARLNKQSAKAKEKVAQKLDSTKDKSAKEKIVTKHQGKEAIRAAKKKFHTHFLDHTDPDKVELRDYISEMVDLEERRSRAAKGTAIGALIGNVPGAAIGYGIGRAVEPLEDKIARHKMKMSIAQSKQATKSQLTGIKHQARLKKLQGSLPQ